MLFKTAFFVFSTDESNFLIYKKAIIAIARMMLVSIYHMILTGEEFQPCDYESFMDPKPNANPSLTVEKALNFLKQSGIDISSIPINL